MLTAKSSFASASVNDSNKAKQFYQEVLGLNLDNEKMGLEFNLPGGGRFFLYQKDDHQPATFTILNLLVDNIDEAVDELTSSGVSFERYDNMPGKQDEKGILRGLDVDQGPNIAWFKDPAGNIISVIQDS